MDIFTTVGKTVGRLLLTRRERRENLFKRSAEEFEYWTDRLRRELAERQRMEEMLRQSQENLRAYLEGAPDGVYLSDLEGVFLYVNQKVEELTGYKREELIGESFLKLRLLSAEYLAKANKLLALNMLAKGAGPDEFELIRKDGRRIWIEIKTTHIKQKGETAVIGFARDITERKQAEEKLRQSEERLRTILETTREGVIFTGADGRISYVNPAAVAILGCKSAAELVGRHVTEVYLDPKQRKAIFEGAAGEDYLENVEVTLKKGDATPVYVLANITIDRNKEGDILRTEAFFTDITERKWAEAERLQLERKAYLTSHLATVGEMASGIAHEINNPLTAVIGFAQLLLQKDIPEDLKRDVKIITDQAQRVASILKRLLTFARQYKPKRQYININDVVETTLALRAYELETGNIKVTTQLDSDLPQTMADGGQLQQVFLNIIINAESEMRLAHGRGKLLVKTETIDNTIRISFKDDGPGIAKENLEKIFEPFFTTRKVGEGTGLGLSICHGIIAEHGGRLYAESELGKGATFVVELPIVAEAKQMGLPPPAVEEPEKVTGAKILVVDDESSVQQFLSRMLIDEGHEVDTTGSAVDALEMIKNRRYSLILVDIKMPGMSGIELYSHIQEVARSLTRRVVFITGDVIAVDTREFISKTKVRYMSKPFDAEQLGKDINQILLKTM